MYIFLFSCVQVVRHGGCLGLGLAAMGTADQGQYIMEEYLSYFIYIFLTDVYQLLKDSLSQDDAVVGEAAGVGMGLVMLGTCSEIAIKDMIEVSNKIMYNNVFIYLFIFLSLSLVL